MDDKTIDLSAPGALVEAMGRLVKTYGGVRLMRALRAVVTDPITRQHLARELVKDSE